MDYKKTYKQKEGLTIVSKIGESSLKYLQFSIIELSDGKSLDFETQNMETAFIILSGKCDISFDGTAWKNVGIRKTVFDGKACAAYVPRNKKVHIYSPWNVKIAVVQTPVDEYTPPHLVDPSDVSVATLGKPTWKRDTHFVINDKVPAKSLYVGEAFVHPGNWAGFPPHKHDENDMPREAVLEEFYYYLFDPPQGFGVQMLYTGDGGLNEAYIIKSDDMVEFPKGYHPIVNAPGYNCYFLWAMAGEHKGFFRKDDPDHHWVSALENFLNKRD